MASLGDIVIGLTMDNRQVGTAAQQTRGQLAGIATSANKTGGMLASAAQQARGALGGLGSITQGITGRFSAAGQQIGQSLSSIGSVATGVVGQVAGLLGVGTALASVGWGVQLAAQAEQTGVAFEVMLGSEEKAKQMLADLKAYADKSPFDSMGTNEAAKKLLNYGVSGERILPTIRMLGDVAAGDAQKLDSLTTAFGQMSATGRLMGGDLNQFINAGFNPLQVIAKKTGESMGDLKKRMEDGGVSSREVAEAFKIATSEGGMFFGMTERQSATIAGRFSTMKDAVATSLRTIGEELITRLNVGGLLENVTNGLSTIPDMFTTTLDMASSIWTTTFNTLYSVADNVLGQIGTAIGVQLNMQSVLTHIAEFGEQVPMIFRNAGSLLQVAILDWQIYLMEFVPGAESVLQKVGAILNATWDASSASFGVFVQNLTAGLIEIKNLALATWDSIKAGITAIASGTNPLVAAQEAFQKTLASQQDANGGKHFTEVFKTTFDQSMKNAEEGFKDQGGLASGLKKERENLLKDIGEKEFKLTQPEIAKKEPGSLNAAAQEAEAEDSNAKKKKDKTKYDSKAALAGSSEAVSIMLRGAFGNNKDDLALKKASLAEQKTTNKILSSQKSAKTTVVNITG